MRVHHGFLLAGALLWGCGGASNDAPPQAASSPPARSVPGRLVLIGGETASPDPDIYRAVLEGRGGNGPICVLPTASSAPTTVMEAARAVLDEQGGEGTASTVFLAQEDAERADDPQIGVELRRCSGFFFTAGRPGRLLDVLMPGGEPTLALGAILDRYRHGAVLAATGATVIALGRVAIESGGSSGAVSEGVTTAEGSDGLFLRPGLGVLGREVVDASFLSEGRVGRLLVAVLAADSASVGVGIGENTALVSDGDSAWVIGASGVTVLDGRRARRVAPHFGSDVRVVLAGAGDRLDLRSLAVTPAADKATVSTEGSTTRVLDPFARWAFLHVMAGLARSDSTQVRFGLDGATMTIREGEGFSAVARDFDGVQGEPAGLSAGPFLLDLLPVGR